MRKHIPVALLLLLVTASASTANVLSGRLFLGHGLALYLEKDEGLFAEMLRAFRLVDGEVPVVNLGALEISREHLFLGQDNLMYLRDIDDGSLYQVGSWSGPGEIRLDPGVELTCTRTRDELFEGVPRDVLHVTLDSSAPTVDNDTVEEAGFEWWVDRLAELYLPGAMSRQEEEEAGLLLGALLGALPTSLQANATQCDNLKRLHKWIGLHPYDTVEGVQVLLEQAMTRLKADAVHGESSNGHATVRDLLNFYEGLASELESR